MADLSELFARLKSPNTPSDSQSQNSYNQPSVSSPIVSPQPSRHPPHHPSAIMSPALSGGNTPGAEGSNDRTTSLLNLLKFNQPQQQTPPRRPTTEIFRQPSGAQDGSSATHVPTARPVSASDHVAAFVKKPSTSVSLQSPAIASPASSRAEYHKTSSSENPQNLLLKLLNNPRASVAQGDASSARHLDLGGSPSIKSPSASVPDLAEHLSTTHDPDVPAIPSLGNTSVAPSGSMFTYANPFEQLERSSPLNRNGRPAPQRAPQPTQAKAHVVKHTSIPSLDGQIPGRSPIRILQGPEKTEISHETVSDAVGELGQQIGKELEEVLSEAKVTGQKKNDRMPSAIAAALKEEAKRDAEDAAAREVVEEALETSVAEVLKDIVNEVVAEDTGENVADSWESADAEDSPSQADETVKVYNFPMRPFTSIDIIKLQDKPPSFRTSTIMEIAKLKKDFDQMDRSLVCASKNFIAYATLKPLGFRVIRQETGQYRPVFSSSKERIFNISMCTPAPGSTATEHETILGTGVNGSIFWTQVAAVTGESLEEENLDDAGFVFPPAPLHDDNTSGGQLKTRAKTSMRHPEFFAVGRGKSIHLVYPKVARSHRYTNVKTGICDSERYLKERSLKILTGKAGKDFAFSADDSVIVSLDKAGKMRFWDIRPLWDAAEENPAGAFEPVTIRNPIWSLQTTSPSEKSWPTSVFFLDKERPLSKGIALRYLVVGQKQNHTLQLWDLGLEKAVQELNLPHDNESDAICTVAYHAKSGVMVVGHPTRNSIYFVHISAPKYNLAAMSQAKYLGHLAEPKSNISKPDSTAIMSGIREYSLGSKGQLRTLHLLEEHAGTAESYGPGDAPVFELYVVHSKGVSLISIHREDLGWTKDFRVSNPVEAATTGAIQVSNLRPAQPVTEGSINGDARTAPSTQATSRDSTKRDSASASTSRVIPQTPEAAIRASTLAKVESKQDAERAAIINNPDKSEKKKKKRATDTASQASVVTSRTIASQPPPSPLPSYAQAARQISPSLPSGTAPASKISDSETPEWALRLLSQPQVATAPSVSGDALTKQFSKSLTEQIDDLYKRIDNDKRALDASSGAKQEAILRLVSSTLSENLDQAFSRHIQQSVNTSILPALNKAVATTLGQQISNAVPRELKSSLPGLVSKAMQEPDTLRIISDLVASKVTATVENQVRGLLQSVGPSIGNMASNAVSNAAKQSASQTDHRITEQFRHAEMQRQADGSKIDQLTKLVQGLAESVQAMRSSQAETQAEILRLRQQLSESQARESTVEDSAITEPKVEEQDAELDTIRALINEGRLEDGTIMWLQSPRQAELFDLLFMRFGPQFIKKLSSLVSLSVAAATTTNLESNLAERLDWLDTVLVSIDPEDPEIVEVVPQIMDVIATRLRDVYMQIAESEGNSAAPLRRLSSSVRKAMDVKAAAQRHMMSNNR